jgi:serine/threonine protein kinase
MSQNDWVGKTLSGRYQIEELLGQGGMSAVYKAMDPNLRRVVAVKMIHPHMSDNEEFVRRFEEEATAVAQLRHENIVQVYDFNNDSGTYYMVLEFVAGETLQQRMKRLQAAGRQLSYTDAVKYIIDVCEAADYAHKRGMIHRDIKPANVILDIHGRAILMDFGIAKIVGGQQHTATGAVIGTALYMAPEQIRGEKIDEGVDIYAIGVTLFEMLNGRPPYEADSAMTLMMMHLNDPIPDLRALHPEVPDDLVAVVDKALSKNRAQRYRSAAEMSAALRKVLERLQKQAPASATIAEAGKAGVATGTARVETPAAPPAPSGVSTIPAERGERVGFRYGRRRSDRTHVGLPSLNRNWHRGKHALSFGANRKDIPGCRAKEQSKFNFDRWRGWHRPHLVMRHCGWRAGIRPLFRRDEQ